MNWLFASGGQSIFSPSSECSGLISSRIDWSYLLAVQGTLKSLLQHHSLKASILYFCVTVYKWASQKYRLFSSRLLLPREDALACISWIPERTGSGFSVGSARGVSPQTWLGHRGGALSGWGLLPAEQLCGHLSSALSTVGVNRLWVTVRVSCRRFLLINYGLRSSCLHFLCLRLCLSYLHLVFPCLIWTKAAAKCLFHWLPLVFLT